MYVCITFSFNCNAQNWFSSVYAWLFGINKNDKLVGYFYEMDKDCGEFVDKPTNQSMHLNTHLKKINPYFCSSKDKALYNFSHEMLTLEAKWHDWYVSSTPLTVNGELVSKTKYHEINLPGEKVRLDFNSPLYRYVQVNQNEYEMGYPLLNMRENQAYHNELQFLRTRLALMKMYKTTDPLNPKNKMQPTNHINKNEENRKKAYSTLREEYKWLKSNAGRQAFTRSCMEKSDYEKLSALRIKYEASKE